MKNTLLKMVMSLLLILFFSCKEEPKNEEKEVVTKNPIAEK